MKNIPMDYCFSWEAISKKNLEVKESSREW